MCLFRNIKKSPIECSENRPLCIFILLFSGCSTSNNGIVNEQKEVSVILPDEETAATVNGYYIPPNNNEIKYYGNIKIVFIKNAQLLLLKLGVFLRDLYSFY